MTARTQPPTHADVKTCSGCGETKPLDQFSIHRRAKDGRQSRCKACNKAYYQANRVWREANRERNAEYSRVWRAANRERAREVSRAWQRANLDRHAANEHRRRARKACAVPQRWVVDHSLGDPLACWWCGRGLLGAKPHLDHVMPISLGGPARPPNEVMTCETCNTRKNAKHPLVWLAEIAS